MSAADGMVQMSQASVTEQFGIALAMQCGLRLVGLSIYAFQEMLVLGGHEGPPQPFLDMVGGPENLLHLRQLRVDSVEGYGPTYPGTSFVRSMVALCPNLEDLAVGLDPSSIDDDGDGHSLQFPVMFRLKFLRILHFNSRLAKLDPSTERVLHPALFPRLEELTVGSTAAAFYGFLDDWENDSGRNWLSERQQDNLLPIRKLTFETDDRHTGVSEISALTVARSLAKRYHPRCILACEIPDHRPAPYVYVAPRDVSTPTAYWFRAVRDLRDQLVEEEVLDMQVGWLRVPIEWQTVSNAQMMESAADE